MEGPGASQVRGSVCEQGWKRAGSHTERRQHRHVRWSWRGGGQGPAAPRSSRVSCMSWGWHDLCVCARARVRDDSLSGEWIEEGSGEEGKDDDLRQVVALGKERYLAG